ncbi:DUF4373 domain-containing protein [Candidatus Marinimicrobia bacterium]|jgi:hypothetical protein|nr:DUF4373 domain-containing protein [Candidatus Neomarinimicrobiota bacterium]
MARPKKNTVDYFSHDCIQNKSLHIIENMYGNDGYSFFFKLRELLGRTHGHSYDLTEFQGWEYLLVVTRVSKRKAEEIMDTLVELGELDEEMLNKEGRIWWQSFVDLLEDVYSRRKNEIPNKDSHHFEKKYGDCSEDEMMMLIQG